MRRFDQLRVTRRWVVPDRWILHTYYTVSPYAPDRSDRLLAAAADLDAGAGEIVVLGAEGEVLDRFGRQPLTPSFFHTGWWQTWGGDAETVHYSGGTPESPVFVRRDLATGEELRIPGSIDGDTRPGAPVLTALLGMLSAADPVMGDGGRPPPIPFQERDRHGIFVIDTDTRRSRLWLSVQAVLDAHPDRDTLLGADAEVRRRLGPDEGLTLLTFCLRWSPDGSRVLFFFGNNGVAPERGEPRIKDVMTCRVDGSDLHRAISLSWGRPGVHWDWQPDNEHLIGYGPDPDDPTRQCLAQVRFDGSGYRRIGRHASGGHPSLSPVAGGPIVTDTSPPHGEVAFVDPGTGETYARGAVPLSNRSPLPPGRTRHRVDAHPVFHPDGDRVMINCLPGVNSELVEIEVPR